MTPWCRTENEGPPADNPADDAMEMNGERKGGPKPRTTAVVVAHPDDEILWLSSAVASAERVVFSFGDPFERPKMAAARRRAVAALSLRGLVDLQLPESGAGFSVDWTQPRRTRAGIGIVDTQARARYEANYEALIESLAPLLTGCSDVYTHNPWGEYGHAEHIQVYRAVTALQAELGYTVWFANYVSSASWSLAQQVAGEPCWTERCAVAPDLTVARRFMGVYRRHGAWTWTRWHRWPGHATFYAQPCGEKPGVRQPLSGEWLLDVAGLRWWPPPWARAHKRLG